MSLEKYKQKRNFKDTPEPEGKVEKRKTKLTFVVQRHHASHLHYDFRLEVNGTLKSWAVPKGPSLNPKDKRLAMMVEDHPISYATFEGDIPDGNYGAGHVDVWDHGTYEPVNEKSEVITQEQFEKDIRSGSIKFRMNGKKLKGEFALVNLKKDEKSWLLIKHRDEHATDEEYTAEDYAKKSSLAYTASRNTGKKTPIKKATVKKAAPKKIAAKKTAAKKTVAKKAVKKKVLTDSSTSITPYSVRKGGDKYTDYIKPMMAKLHDAAFDSKDWIFEIKWDGYRAIAELNARNSRLYSRNGLSFEMGYAAIFEELKKIKQKIVLDGEIVALDEDGKPSFQLLQQYGMNPESSNLVYYVFDLLYVNGTSVEKQPLIERKDLLKSLLPESDVIKYCDHIEGKGTAFFKAMQKQGLEGMIAKRADSHYYEGKRSGDWLKVKHMLTDEAVIAGYTEARGGRKFFGALILGVYENGKLQYIGHTGTGFDDKTLREVHKQMQPLVTDENPFGTKVRVNSPVTWVEPRLVCNLKFTEVTADGNRRHPVFMGLRIDKAAEDVTGEAPVAKEAKEPVETPAKKTKTATEPNDSTMDKTTTISGKKLTLTNQDKIYWPDEGYTKGDVIAYYASVYKYIGKYLKDRPESLKRNPNGIKGPAFFHKDAGEQAPDWMATYPTWSESAEKTIDYLLINDKPSLLYVANLGCIEINPWNSRTANPDKPDYLVIDLDPSDKNSFNDVVDCAHVVKGIFDSAGIDSYCKTSGSTGLHIYIPLGAKYDYEQTRQFAEIIAQMTVDELPNLATIERSLSKRAKNKVYIDFLQNKEGATLSTVYSLRPKPGAPVSTPLDWKEVKHGIDPRDYNIENTVKRLEKRGDLFAPVLKKGIDMIKSLKHLGM
ncbi:MAG: DNA ligase D [Sphingobacteriales bacterium]|nr:MAG: DNA ligase D [Sphingobacteriales bacterium]